MGWIIGQVFDFFVPDIACEGLLGISYAGFDVFRVALHEKLDGAIGTIADVAGEVQAACNAVGGKAKADTLNRAGKDYLFGNHK